MPKRVFADTEILDRGADLFQDELFKDEILDSFYRGLISETDLLDRIKFVKSISERRALTDLEREHEDSFDRDIYGESGVA